MRVYPGPAPVAGQRGQPRVVATCAAAPRRARPSAAGRPGRRLAAGAPAAGDELERASASGRMVIGGRRPSWRVDAGGRQLDDARRRG